ncbi:MAG: hypothetical protein LC108_02340 [Anaerolineales bacterium]|nr:hypothetical protein [Anaerolineales bacterium]
MKKKYITILSVLVLTIVSACGPAPEPTLSVEEISNTAVANLWVALTATQLAQPTATATFPPTETFTPQPTFTSIPINTLPPPPPAATATSQCNQIPVPEPKGALVKVKFVNQSKGNVNLSFGMLAPNAQGECFTYSYTLGAFDAPVVTVLAGCYWAYGWVTVINSNKTSTAQNMDALCITDPAKEPDIWITEEVISFH